MTNKNFSNLINPLFLNNRISKDEGNVKNDNEKKAQNL